MTQERFIDLTVINSHKTRRDKFDPPPTPHINGGGHRSHTLKKSVWTLAFAYGQSPHTDDDFCCGKHLFSRWQRTNQYPNHGDLPLYVRQGFSVRVLVIHCLAFWIMIMLLTTRNNHSFSLITGILPHFIALCILKQQMPVLFSKVGQKRWKVETFSRLDSVLLLSSVNLPGGELVRKTLNISPVQRLHFFSFQVRN